MGTFDILSGLRSPDTRGMGRVETPTPTVGCENIQHLQDLDAFARHVRMWDSTVVPGNLQTASYSAAVIRLAYPHLSDHDVYGRMRAKQERRIRFRDAVRDPQNGFHAYVVIGERAVTHGVTDSPSEHVAQLRQLSYFASEECPGISLQVIPEGIPETRVAANLSMYMMRDGARVSYMEDALGGWYSSRAEHTDRLLGIFQRLARKAMTAEETRQFIGGLVEEWPGQESTSYERTEGSRSFSPRTRQTEITASE
jgi:hypothetical protein